MNNVNNTLRRNIHDHNIFLRMVFVNMFSTNIEYVHWCVLQNNWTTGQWGTNKTSTNNDNHLRWLAHIMNCQTSFDSVIGISSQNIMQRTCTNTEGKFSFIHRYAYFHTTRLRHIQVFTYSTSLWDTFTKVLLLFHCDVQTTYSDVPVFMLFSLCVLAQVTLVWLLNWSGMI